MFAQETIYLLPIWTFKIDQMNCSLKASLSLHRLQGIKRSSSYVDGYSEGAWLS